MVRVTRTPSARVGTQVGDCVKMWKLRQQKSVAATSALHFVRRAVALSSCLEVPPPSVE